MRRHGSVVLGFTLWCILGQLDAIFFGTKKVELKMLERKKPFYELGQVMKAQCTISDSNLANKYNASDLVFAVEYQGTDGKDLYTRNSTYFRIMEENMALLVIPKAKYEYHRSHISCRLPGEKAFDTSDNIHILLPPIQPWLAHCQVDCWRNMTCGWGPHTSLQNHTNIDRFLEHIVEWRIDGGEWAATSVGRNVHQFTWTRGNGFVMGGRYEINITVKAVNADLPPSHGISAESDIEVVDTKAIVRPCMLDDPRTKVKTVQDEVEISYMGPATVGVDLSSWHFDYRLCVWSKWEGDQARCTTVVDKLSQTLPVIPGTSYNANISAKCVDCSDLYWSQQTLFEFHVPSTDPKRPPRVDRTSFSVIETTDESRTVELYWEDLPASLYYGTGFQYEVKVTTDPFHWKLLFTTPDFMYRQKISHAASYIKVLSCNTNGCTEVDSDQTDTIFIPASDDVLPEPQLVVEEEGSHGNRTFFLSIEPHKQISGQQLDANLVYTLFWCPAPSNNYQCQESPRWERLNAGTTELVKTEAELLPTQATYAFGLSVQTAPTASRHRRSPPSLSGIAWVTWSYYADKLPMAPSNVKVTADEPRSLKVMWDKPADGSGAGFVQHYKVYYGMDCQSSITRHNLSMPWIIVAGNQNSVVIEGLEPNREYCVYVLSEGRAGSAWSDSMEPAPVAMVTDHPLAEKAVIVGLVLAILTFGGLLIAGIFVVIRRSKRFHSRIRSPLDIQFPDQLGARPQLSSTSSELPLFSDNNSYTSELCKGLGRQHSTSSQDSGHFSFDGKLSSDDGLPLVSRNPYYSNQTASPVTPLPSIPEDSDTDQVFSAQTGSRNAACKESGDLGAGEEDDASSSHYASIAFDLPAGLPDTSEYTQLRKDAVVAGAQPGPALGPGTRPADNRAPMSIEVSNTDQTASTAPPVEDAAQDQHSPSSPGAFSATSTGSTIQEYSRFSPNAGEFAGSSNSLNDEGGTQKATYVNEPASKAQVNQLEQSPAAAATISTRPVTHPSTLSSVKSQSPDRSAMDPSDDRVPKPSGENQSNPVPNTLSSGYLDHAAIPTLSAGNAAHKPVSVPVGREAPSRPAELSSGVAAMAPVHSSSPTKGYISHDMIWPQAAGRPTPAATDSNHNNLSKYPSANHAGGQSAPLTNGYVPHDFVNSPVRARPRSQQPGASSTMAPVTLTNGYVAHANVPTVVPSSNPGVGKGLPSPAEPWVKDPKRDHGNNGYITQDILYNLEQSKTSRV